MRSISFFSKFAFICNISFVLFVIFNRLESAKVKAGGQESLVALPFLKDLIIILGVSAIVINLIMCLVYTLVIIFRKTLPLPRWLTMVNYLFLVVQFYFFFFNTQLH